MKKKSALWITLALLGVLVPGYRSYALARPVSRHKRQASHIQCMNAAPRILITFSLTNAAAKTWPKLRP